MKDNKKKKESAKLVLPDAPTEALTNNAKQKIYNEVEDYYFEIFKNSGQESDTGFQNEKITLDEKNQLNKYLGRLDAPTEALTNDAKQKIYTEVEDYFFNQFKVSGKESDAEFQNEKITSVEKTQLNIYLRKLGLETSLIKSTNTKWKTVFNNLSQGQDLLLFSKRLSALGEGDINEVQDF